MPCRVAYFSSLAYLSLCTFIPDIKKLTTAFPHPDICQQSKLATNTTKFWKACTYVSPSRCQSLFGRSASLLWGRGLPTHDTLHIKSIMIFLQVACLVARQAWPQQVCWFHRSLRWLWWLQQGAPCLTIALLNTSFLVLLLASNQVDIYEVPWMCYRITSFLLIWKGNQEGLRIKGMIILRLFWLRRVSVIYWKEILNIIMQQCIISNASISIQKEDQLIRKTKKNFVNILKTMSTIQTMSYQK